MKPEIIGFIGSATIACSLFPQVYKSWKTKSTKDISLLWNTVLSIGLILFVVYGFQISSLPIMVFTTIEASLALSLLILKFIYK